MTCKTIVGLVDHRMRSEETFTIDPNKLALFQSNISKDNNRTLVPADEQEYKIMRIALSYFSDCNLFYRFDDLTLHLTAGNKYSPELKNRAVEMLATRMLGKVDLEEVENILFSIQEENANSLLPFIVCNLLHCPAELLDNTDVYADIIELVKELRARALDDDASDAEIHRYDIQTEINLLGIGILRIKNRCENVVNLPESRLLAELLLSFETMSTHYTEYLKEEPSVGEVFFRFRSEECLSEMGKQLEVARRMLKSLTDLRPEIMSERTAQRKITLCEQSLQKRVIELSKYRVTKSKPEGFTPLSFMLCPGVEVSYIQGKSVLWISETDFEKIPVDLVQKILDVLKIEKLAIGEKVFDREPMIEYYKYSADRLA